MCIGLIITGQKLIFQSYSDHPLKLYGFKQTQGPNDRKDRGWVITQAKIPVGSLGLEGLEGHHEIYNMRLRGR